MDGKNLIKINVDKLEQKIKTSKRVGAVARKYVIPEQIIEKYDDLWDWNTISFHQTLSLPFIEKHLSKLNLMYVAICQSLSDDFIEKHIDLFDFKHICLHQQLSYDFVVRNMDKIKVDFLKRNKKVNQDEMSAFYVFRELTKG